MPFSFNKRGFAWAIAVTYHLLAIAAWATGSDPGWTQTFLILGTVYLVKADYR